MGSVRSAPVAVRGDPASLATLLANLLDNALRYTPAGGRVDVAVDEVDGAAVLIVMDTGPGIPVAERESVFERFRRGSSANDAAAVGGSGLGLSIVMRIATAHGATVVLEDGAAGQGLTVRVRFPPVAGTS
jgi:signal transduction histidine kinase